MRLGEEGLRRLLRRLRPHPRPLSRRDPKGARTVGRGETGTLSNSVDLNLAIAVRLDAIESQLRTLNRLLGGSLLAILAEFIRQLANR